MNKMPIRRGTPLFEVRHSSIHGFGVFAARRIRKGTAVIEYLGERVSHREADARYKDKDPHDNHTFLFTVDEKTVIDAGVNGNEARYINHGCDPNCESIIVNKCVLIMAIRTIQPGEELAYDYQIQRDRDDAADVDEVYACRCGAGKCRGSMLEAPNKASRKKRKPARRAPNRAAGNNGRKRPARRDGMAARLPRRETRER
jgi:SET domain-containing protein